MNQALYAHMNNKRKMGKKNKKNKVVFCVMYYAWCLRNFQEMLHWETQIKSLELSL
jgi:hypothetical protein